MKKILLPILLSFTAVACKAQQNVPYMSNIDLYASLIFNERPSYPLQPRMFQQVHVDDTLWIYGADGWEALWPPAHSGGTVTRVSMSGGTTGLTFNGGPITTTGTFTVGGVLAITNGGTGTSNSTGSGSLVLAHNPTFTGTPMAPTAPLGTNTVQLATTEFVMQSMGAAGNGTVTSVAVSGGTTGLTVSGSPITTSGTITISGTLAVENGGTGTTTATGTGSLVRSASPDLTGVPTAPTASVGTNTTQLATTAFVIANSGSGSIDGTLTANKAVYATDANTVAASTNIEMSADSAWMKNQDTGELEFVGLTPTGAFKVIKPATSVQIEVPDTLAGATITTGYVLAIGSNLAGCNLIAMEGYYGDSQGTAVPTLVAYRNRSEVEVNMTSTGANFTTNATIDPTYDDVLQGDRIEIRMTLGSGTPPEGVKVILKFRKP